MVFHYIRNKTMMIQKEGSNDINNKENITNNNKNNNDDDKEDTKTNHGHNQHEKEKGNVKKWDNSDGEEDENNM